MAAFCPLKSRKGDSVKGKDYVAGKEEEEEGERNNLLMRLKRT